MTRDDKSSVWKRRVYGLHHRRKKETAAGVDQDIKIICEECSKDNLMAGYEGETGRIPYYQGLEHQNDLKNQKSTWNMMNLMIFLKTLLMMKQNYHMSNESPF